MVNVFKMKPRESYGHPRVKRMVDILTDDLKDGFVINPRGRHISVLASTVTIPVEIYYNDHIIYSYGRSTDKLAVRIGEALERGEAGDFNVYQVWE